MNLARYFHGVAVALCFTACTSSADEQQRIEDIKAEAHAAHPGDLVEGTKAANSALERERNRGGKELTPKESAALVFLGYYTKNVYGMPQVCSEHNIRLATYSSRFAELHAPLLKTASTFVDSTSAIARTKPKVLASAKQELERVAKAQGTDLQGICSLIEANGAAIAEGAQFARIMPSTYTQLVQSP